MVLLMPGSWPMLPPAGSSASVLVARPGGVGVSECAWSPNCPQEPFGESPFCYFHEKRARGYISGYITAPGLTVYSEPTAKVKAIIEQLYERAVDE